MERTALARLTGRAPLGSLGGRAGQGALLGSPCPRSAEKGAARQRSPGGGGRTRTMSSQPGHCVQAAPPEREHPKPQKPPKQTGKAAPGPAGHGHQPPPPAGGQTRAREAAGDGFTTSAFIITETFPRLLTTMGFSILRELGSKRKKKLKKKKKPQQCLPGNTRTKICCTLHIIKNFDVCLSQPITTYFDSVHFYLVKPHILEQAHYLNCHFRSAQRTHFLLNSNRMN